MNYKTTVISVASALAFGVAGAATAAEVKLPGTIAWSAYNTGTTGYNQSVAIGKALKDKYGVNLRVVPGKTIFPVCPHSAMTRYSLLPMVAEPISHQKVFSTSQRKAGALKKSVW